MNERVMYQQLTVICNATHSSLDLRNVFVALQMEKSHTIGVQVVPERRDFGMMAVIQPQTKNKGN
jgi:hypothetical protein